MNLEGNAAALALIIAGMSAGAWATMVSFKLRAMHRELRAFRREFQEFLTAAGVAIIAGQERTDGADRYPGRLLDDSPAWVRGPGRGV